MKLKLTINVKRKKNGIIFAYPSEVDKSTTIADILYRVASFKHTVYTIQNIGSSASARLVILMTIFLFFSSSSDDNILEAAPLIF